MIVEGEKYACDACIRGHRVSSCTHRDRKLTHVNKKGRPLTQCPHCRGLRKSRAAHVKCDCGEGSHIRETSSEGTEIGCKCQTGKRCTCSLKKEQHDVGDIHRVHSMTASSRSAVHKPRLPGGHHSDSAVPRIRAPVFPPAHRMHQAYHDHGHPYAIRPSQNEFLDRSQPSLDGSQLARPFPTVHQASPQPTAAVPMLHRHLSNPVYSSPSPRLRHTLPPLRVASQSPMPDFSASLDMSTMYKAISPGNPARYSFHDIPDVSLDALARPMPDNIYMVNDEWMDSNEKWLPSDIIADIDEHGNPTNAHPITPSDVSVEYSLPSQFAMSSSGSEQGDATAQPNGYTSHDLPFRSPPPIPSMLEMNGKPGMATPAWFYDMAGEMPAYAASDPGVFNAQGQADNIGYSMEDLQGSNPNAETFLNNNMERYDLTIPMMTENAVRDWVPNPAQMQDPNYAFEVPTQYLPPMMEGNYGWI